MKSIIAASVLALALGLGSSAADEPIMLSNEQLDSLTAGNNGLGSSMRDQNVSNAGDPATAESAQQSAAAIQEVQGLRREAREAGIELDPAFSRELFTTAHGIRR